MAPEVVFGFLDGAFITVVYHAARHAPSTRTGVTSICEYAVRTHDN